MVNIVLIGPARGSIYRSGSSAVPLSHIRESWRIAALWDGLDLQVITITAQRITIPIRVTDGLARF